MNDWVELRWFLSVIRRWLWLVVVCVLLGAIGAYWVSSRMAPVYSASATLLVDQAPATDGSDYSAILASERLAGTYVQMMRGRPVTEAAVARLGLEETPRALADRVSVRSIPDTQLIRLSVAHTDPSLAALLANTIAEVFIAQIQALQAARYADSLTSMQQRINGLSALVEETQAKIDALGAQAVQDQTELAHLETLLAEYRSTHTALQQDYEQMQLMVAQSTNNVIVFETAQVPKSPVAPRKLMYTVLAAVVSAMLALGAGFLVEYLDDTIKTREDVNQTLGLGTLGAIGRMAKGEKELVVIANPLSPISESFRVLRTNVRFSSVDNPLRTILMTSPGIAEGKSTTVANLAAAMAQAGLNVVAMDADLRRPRLDQLFGLDRREQDDGERLRWGLTGSLLDGCTNGKLHPTQVKGLRVLPSGKLPPNPAEMVGSQSMHKLLHDLAEQADIVLIDSPPVLSMADATVLAQAVDGVLLVLHAGKTRREAARHTVERLRQVGANLVGVVLSNMPIQKGSYYYYDHMHIGNGNGRRDQRWRRWKGPLAALRRLLKGK